MDATATLREVRDRLGLTAAELALLAGVDESVVDALERGASVADETARARIATVLGFAGGGPIRADWDALRALGLSLSGPMRDDVERNAATLNLHVRRAAEELECTARGVREGARTETVTERHRDALGALISGGRRHFPTATTRLTDHEPTRRILEGPHDVGRRLKLARVAIARLAEYL